MFAILQFPISDLRTFSKYSNKLSLPRWPNPEPDKEYVRAFGHIRHRTRGGLNGWLGESLICDANKALKLDSNNPVLNIDYPFILKKIAFRRFYFDGIAMGKFEIGLIFQSNARNVRSTDFIQFLAGIKFKSGNNTDSKIDFKSFTNHFCKKYLDATSVKGHSSKEDEYLVVGGRPSIYIEYNKYEFDLPKHEFSVVKSNTNFNDFALHFWRERINGIAYPVWAAENVFYRNFPVIARQLRIYLLRLHAEHQTLAHILNAIADEKLIPEPFSRQSDLLQRYVSDAEKRITRIENITTKSANLDINSIAAEIDYLAKPGQQDALLRQLDIWKPRPNVKRLVHQKANTINNLYMSGGIMNKEENNNYGQAGIVGSHGTVKDSTFNQKIINGNNIPTEQLAQELNALIIKLKEKVADDGDTDKSIDINLIESSIKAAEKPDIKSSVSYIKRCTDWVLGVAKEIGVNLVVEIIKGKVSF